VHEEDQILAKIRRGESVEHFETLRRAKDGRLINVSVTISAIKDATGKVTGVSKVAHDITGAQSSGGKNLPTEPRIGAARGRTHRPSCSPPTRNWRRLVILYPTICARRCAMSPALSACCKTALVRPFQKKTSAT